MAWGMAAQIIQMLAAGASAYNDLSQATAKNKTIAPGTPAGGSTPQQAQNVFSAGQPQPKALRENTAALKVERDPAIQAQTSALAGQPYLSADTGPKELPPLQPSDIQVTRRDPNMSSGLGNFLSGLEGASSALAAVAPLLAFQSPQRGAITGGGGGGQPGQVIFQMPQRQSLAQILASLPRTM